MIKKWMISFTLVLSLILLSACGTNENVVTTTSKSGLSHTYHLGEKVAQAGFKYFYGGKTQDSIVINQLQKDCCNNAVVMPLFVDWKENPIVELEDGKLRFRIEDVDVVKGTIQIQVLE